MPYLALVDDRELELADEAAIAKALAAGQITAETWIKDVNVEADWETVEEMFPHITLL